LKDFFVQARQAFFFVVDRQEERKFRVHWIAGNYCQGASSPRATGSLRNLLMIRLADSAAEPIARMYVANINQPLFSSSSLITINTPAMRKKATSHPTDALIAIRLHAQALCCLSLASARIRLGM